jgi:hypothetical protein
VKYPRYDTWCKKKVIETIRKQKIHDSKKYLQDFVFNPDSDLYSNGVYDYEVCEILGIINDELDHPQTSLFAAVQHEFAEKYFHMAQEMNPQTDMLTIRRNDSENMDLLYRTLENDIAIDELKDAVFYAFEYGTEEVEEPKIPYVKTNTDSIAEALKSRLIEIESVHINYVDPEAERKEIPVNEFKDYFMHLKQSGIFADTINWRYVDLFDSGKFLIESDIYHNNGYELNVVIATKNKEDKDRVVKILEESEE